jgi:hypothetical protein
VYIAGRCSAVSHNARVGDQMMWRGFGNHCRDDVAGAHVLSRRRKVHQPTVPGSPAHARRSKVLAALPRGDEQLDGTPHLGPVFFQGDLFLQLNQSVIAFLHNSFRDLFVKVGGWRAGPLRVLEGERTREPSLPHNVKGGREVFLSFAGETHD